MTRYKLLKSSISLEDFEDLLAFSVAKVEFDKNQNKPCWRQLLLCRKLGAGNCPPDIYAPVV